jgi:dTDP-4-dehydrorhamnose reductase
VEVIAWSGSRSGELLGIPLHLVDITRTDTLVQAFHQARPTAVIHTAALASVAACHQDPARAERTNAEAARVLAELAREAKVRFIHTSTDLVFDGEKGWYREEDAPAPLSQYGRSKQQAEPAVLAAEGVVVRLSLLYGPTLIDRPYFFDEQLMALRERRPITLFQDEWRTPLSLAAAARALLALLDSDFIGLIHLGGPERLSRLEMGQRLAAAFGLDASVLVAKARTSAPTPEPRPRDTSLDCSRWRSLFPSFPLPGWNESLAELRALAAEEHAI